MKFRDFIPPAALSFGRAIARSFATSVARWVRGADSEDAPQGRLLEPYGQSAWVRAAVNAVANPISGRPLKFYDGEQEFTNQAFLSWWDKPAIGPKVRGVQTRLKRAQVQFDLAAWERLEGEFFIVLDDSWLLTAGRSETTATSLAPFLIANPQRMQVILEQGELVGWRYVDAAGKQLILLPQQVIHHKSFNPYDDWRGLGGMKAARVAAEGAFLTGVYIRDLARNNGDRGMVVIAKSGVVTDPQREQILADLRAKRSALNRGIVKDMLVSGDITVDRPKEQTASPELTSSKAMSHEEVFVAFNVPPSLGAVKQSYSIGKESDKYQLITDTCQPVGGVVAGALAEVASMQVGRELTCELDWDDHPVMVEVRNSRIESALKLWGVGMPIKDASEYLDLGIKRFAGWDVGYLPFSVAPVDSLDEPTKDPQLREEPVVQEPDAVKSLRVLLALRKRSTERLKPVCTSVEREFQAFACSCGEGGIAQKGRPEKEVAQWRTLIAQRRATVKSFESGFGRVLMAARQETLRNIERLVSRSVAGQQLTKAAVADLLFDLTKFAEGFTATMRDRSRAALGTAGKQLFAELGKDDPFVYPPEAVLDFLAGRENKLRDTPAAVHEEIKAALEEGLNAGDTVEQLSARVRGAFNGISNERARRIAMTETAAAYGAGRDEAMQQAGVQFKRWLTSGGDNVRSAHADANGQTVPVDQPFEVGGEQLMFPGDDAGSAGNVINCHCVSVAVSEPSDS